MNDPKSRHSDPRRSTTPGPGKSDRPSSPGNAPARPAARTGGDGATGKVVHDDRGNAVWDWLADSGRRAIEATSRLLRKLEMPELKVEDSKDEELRITPEPSTGGGYDPYNQVVKPPKKFGNK